MSVVFNNESRPDLAAAVKLDYTCEYVSNIIFPTINVYEDGGQISVATTLAASADTNRAYNADLTVNHFGNTPVIYACSGYDCRIALTDGDIKAKGDDIDIILAEAANVGAEGAYGKLEESIPTILNTATQSVTAASGATFAALAEASYKVGEFGEPTLVCSQWFFTQLLGMSAFTDPILKLFGDRVITDILGGSDTVAKAVGNWMGLPGGIHIAKDKFFKGAAASENPGYIVGLRPEMRDPARAYWTAKARPTLGATLVYTPRDAEDRPFSVDTVYLSSNKLNCVDVTFKAIPKVFNLNAICKVNLPA